MILRWGMRLLLPLHSCNENIVRILSSNHSQTLKNLPPFPFVPASAYTSNVEIEGSEHFELSSTGGDGGGAGG